MNLFVAPDNCGGLAIWAASTERQPVLVLSRWNLAPEAQDLWEHLVDRLTEAGTA